MEFNPKLAKYEYTDINHLHYKFLNNTNTYDANSSYCIYSGSPQALHPEDFRIQLDVKSQIIKCAQKIYDCFPKPLVLYFSGGLDSEIMIQIFIEAGLDFKIVLVRYENNFNLYDLNYAIEFCESKNLKYIIIPFNLEKFYESGRHFEISFQHRCRSPQFSVHFEWCTQLDLGTSIFPYEPVSFIPFENKFFLGIPDDHYFAYLRFFYNLAKPAVPYFFQYSPDLIRAWINLPTYQKLLTQSINNIYSRYELKCQIYREAGFTVKPRPNKWTGFEKFKLYIAEKYKDPLAYENNYRIPLENKFPFPKYPLQSFPLSYFPFWKSNRSESDKYFSQEKIDNN